MLAPSMRIRFWEIWRGSLMEPRRDVPREWMVRVRREWSKDSLYLGWGLASGLERALGMF